MTQLYCLGRSRMDREAYGVQREFLLGHGAARACMPLGANLVLAGDTLSAEGTNVIGAPAGESPMIKQTLATGACVLASATSWKSFQNWMLGTCKAERLAPAARIPAPVIAT